METVGKAGADETTASSAVPGSPNSFQLVSLDDWADPHPLYHRMRREQPIQPLPAIDGWALTRWADCERILRDPSVSVSQTSRRVIADDQRFAGPAEALGSEIRILLFMDPPDHTRLRRLVSSAFTPRTVERLRGHVASLVAGMLDDAEGRAKDGDGTVDLIAEVGYRLPVTVICELLGVPVADRDLFAPWSSAASRLLDGELDQTAAMEGIGALMQFVNYFNDLFDTRRNSPGHDLISDLLAGEDEGERLTHAELLSTVLLLFIAGHETTTNLIGNGTVALMRNRDQWDRLVADPGGLAAAAVEETLRWDGPVHVTGRVATEDMRVGDDADAFTVEAGQWMICALAAANRDPARFLNPDHFDLARADTQHLAFSYGIHYCLGAALARMEGQEAFAALARRFPDMELAEIPAHRAHFVLRGYQQVRVAL